MTESRILAIALRVLGVWTFIGLIQYIGHGWYIGMVSQSDQSIMSKTGWLLATFMPIVFSALISFILLRFPLQIAAKLSPEKDQPLVGVPTDYEKLFDVCIRIVGVVLLVGIIPANLVQIVINFSAHPVTGIKYDLQTGGWNLILRTILQLGFGGYLLYGAPVLSRIAKAGIAKSEITD